MAKLTDFGGGYSSDDANPEDEVNKKLSQWIVRHGSNRVFWDRKRSYGHGTFSISTQRRPDLVIVADGGNYIVEVKQGDHSRSIYEGISQLFDYWHDIETGEAKYTVNGEEKEIEAALLATRYSAEGHLFHTRQNKDPRRTGRGKRSQDAIERRLIPAVEHTASETALRVAYRWARHEYDSTEEIDGKTGFGFLYSSALDEDEPGTRTSIPAAHHIAPGRGQQAESWDYIPFYKKPGVQ